MAAGLHHHHWLGARGDARGRHELACIADRFHVQQDGAGAMVGGEVIQHVAEIHVQRFTQRDHAGKTDGTRHAPFHQPRCHRTGLRHKRKVTGQRLVRRHTGIEARVRRDESNTARTHQAHAFGPCGGFDSLGDGARTLPQPTTQYQCSRYTAFGGFGDHRGDRMRWRGDDGQVRYPRQVMQPRSRAEALDLPVTRIDHRDLPWETAADQVVQDHATRRTFAGAGTNHCHRLRHEDGGKTVSAHAQALLLEKTRAKTGLGSALSRMYLRAADDPDQGCLTHDCCTHVGGLKSCAYSTGTS